MVAFLLRCSLIEPAPSIDVRRLVLFGEDLTYLFFTFLGLDLGNGVDHLDG